LLKVYLAQNYTLHVLFKLSFIGYKCRYVLDKGVDKFVENIRYLSCIGISVHLNGISDFKLHTSSQW
jgi:hypothetical protein